jgi:hypothetical protein
MKKKLNGVRLLVLGAAFWFVLQGQALAYLDMNTGSYFIQLLISSILAGLFLIKHPYLKLKDYFGRVFGKK